MGTWLVQVVVMSLVAEFLIGQALQPGLCCGFDVTGGCVHHMAGTGTWLVQVFMSLVGAMLIGLLLY